MITKNIITILVLILAYSKAFNLVAQEKASTTLAGHKLIPYGVKSDIEEIRKLGFDIDRFPLFQYVLNEDVLIKLKLGDSIPEGLWNMPLTALHRTDTIHTIRLNDYREKDLIIIDSWAHWCTPCIKSMYKWEELTSKYPNKVALVGLHLDFSYPALSNIKKHNWNSASIYGLDARIINRSFFDVETGSSLIWIYKGKLFALTYSSNYDLKDAISLIEGENIKIPSINERLY